MLQASILSSPDYSNYAWSDEELRRLNAHLVGLPPWTTASPRQEARALNTQEGPRTSSAQTNHDPLAALSARELFIECVWGSPESSVTKIMLLCIARFFDDNARSSSMSFAQ